MTPDAIEVFSAAIASDAPVSYGPQTGRAVPDTSKRFSVQSQVAMAIHPQIGEPWLLGMHQCSHARLWTEEEQELLQEIGHRMADSLTSLLILQDLQASQEEVRSLNEELEQRILERTAQLQAANKELEAFAYSVSHDLRAPLRGIDGFSQALLEDYGHKLDAEGQDYLRRVRAASQRMGQLIDDLLQLSHLMRIEISRELVDLSALAQNIIQELRRTQPEREVEIIISPKLVANGDERLLRVVLENLLGNAWKFTGKREKARIEFGETRVNGQPTFFLQDNGAGFNLIYADKLFRAFQRLHSPTEFEGTGIGLATVQRIIHRHGGRVWAEAEVDQGATFYFTISPEGTKKN